MSEGNQKHMEEVQKLLSEENVVRVTFIAEYVCRRYGLSDETGYNISTEAKKVQAEYFNSLAHRGELLEQDLEQKHLLAALKAIACKQLNAQW